MIQICYTYNILRTFSLIVWSIFVWIFSIFSCIYIGYISMIYIMPTLLLDVNVFVKYSSARLRLLIRLIGLIERHAGPGWLFVTVISENLQKTWISKFACNQRVWKVDTYLFILDFFWYLSNKYEKLTFKNVNFQDIQIIFELCMRKPCDGRSIHVLILFFLYLFQKNMQNSICFAQMLLAYNAEEPGDM